MTSSIPRRFHLPGVLTTPWRFYYAIFLPGVLLAVFVINHFFPHLFP